MKNIITPIPTEAGWGVREKQRGHFAKNWTNHKNNFPFNQFVKMQKFKMSTGLKLASLWLTSCADNTEDLK